MSMRLLCVALMVAAAGAVVVMPRKAPLNSTAPVSNHVTATAAHVPTKVLGQTDTIRRRIEPELDPTSHKKFFNKDYPDDKHPAVAKDFKFEHPYPVVQESSAFAKDYVKDENGDGGQWKAQMDYDTLRHQIKAEEEEAKKAAAKEREEAKELEEAAEKQKKAEKEAEEAKKKADKAAEDVKKADEKAEEAVEAEKKAEEEKTTEEKEERGKQATEVNDAKKKVEKEMEDLTNCKQELEEARAKLKAALEANEKQHVADGAKVDEAEKEVEETKSAEEAAEKAKATAEEEEAKEVAEKKKLKDEVSEEKAEHDKALKAYEAQKAKLAKTEADLAAAQERIRGTSSPKAPESKSGASAPWSFMMTPLIAAVVSIMSCTA